MGILIDWFYKLINDWTAIFTLFLAIIAWVQIRKFNKTTRAEFIHKFKTDFFSKELELVIFYIENELLEFKIEKISDKPCPYFQIKKNEIEKISDIFNKYKKYAEDHEYTIQSDEIDNLLLGQIEDMGLIRKRKIINTEYIYETFYYYIQKIHSNSAIQDYIKWIKDDFYDKEGEDYCDIYDNYEYITNKCKNYENKKMLKSQYWFKILLFKKNIHK